MSRSEAGQDQAVFFCRTWETPDHLKIIHLPTELRPDHAGLSCHDLDDDDEHSARTSTSIVVTMSSSTKGAQTGSSSIPSADNDCGLVMEQSQQFRKGDKTDATHR